jgi:putative cell wall-binding protein
MASAFLTNTSALDKATLDEIKRLGAKNVKILGGEGAISQTVIDQLVKNGIKKENIERIAGRTRFGTAAAIAQKLSDKPTDVFFVYGLGCADALSVSTVAAIKGAPIIYLTTSGELNPDTAAYLAALKAKNCVSNAYVIGGEGVISDDMMNKAKNALGLDTITRVAGKNRYATCVEVNNKFKDVLTGSAVCVAKGLDFPDALAGGVFAAQQKAPLFLADNALTDEQKTYLKTKKADTVYVFGGTGAVPDKLVT